MIMRVFVSVLFCIATLATPVMSQEEPAETPTPQSIAMELFGAANRYYQAEDFEAANRMLEAALDIKPGHPTVLRYLLMTAMASSNTDDAFNALERMIAAGIVFDPSRFEEALRTADDARFQTILDAFAANNLAVGDAERFAIIDAPDALIEGVAMDIETDRLFVSSVAQRQILMLEPFGRDDPIVFADASDGLWSVFGLAVDDRTRMVWAASGVVPQTPLETDEEAGTALFAFDLVTGDLYRRYEIDGAGQIADFVVRDGVVYASDSRAPRIYVLDTLTSELRVLVEDERFVNLQGIALARGALYVADYSLGIWRVDLGDQSVSLVRPGAESLIGIDGLLNSRDGRIIAVRNGVTPYQVMAIDLDRDGLAVANIEVLLRNHPDMAGQTEPTLIDLADGRGWLIANGAWPLFPEDGSEPESTRPATVVLELDIP
jgi:tetratricopeptide (TPR) repeat protein